MSQEAQTDDDGTLDLKSDQEAKVKEKVQKGLTLGQILSQKLKGFFNGLGQYCRRLFTVPLVKDIIYFDCGGPHHNYYLQYSFAMNGEVNGLSTCCL